MTNENTPCINTLLRRARKSKKYPPSRRHNPSSKVTLRRLPDTPQLRRLCESQAAFFHALDELREYSKSIRALGTITEWLDSVDELLWEFDDLFDEFSQGEMCISDLAKRWGDEIAHSLEEWLVNAPILEVPGDFDSQWVGNLVDDLTKLIDVKCEKINNTGYAFYGAIQEY